MGVVSGASSRPCLPLASIRQFAQSIAAALHDLLRLVPLLLDHDRRMRLKLGPAERSEAAADRLGQIDRLARGRHNRLGEDRARLRLDGSAVARGAQAQRFFDLDVEIADRES